MTVERLTTRLWSGGPLTTAWRLAGDEVALTITELGAHLVDVEVWRDGRWIPISVGYPPATPAGFHGATVGRWANRIAGSRFELEGAAHELVANEGVNQLHGGPEGFDRRRWRGKAEAGTGGGEVRLSLSSPDGDQGFPGTLDASARYVLADRTVTIEYGATTDRPTPVNLTSHGYWNLAGTGSLDGHRLTVRADHYVMVDDANIPVAGPPAAVEGSRFDARSGLDLARVTAEGGLDHCFVLDSSAAGPQVELSHEAGGRITFTTDQIGVQIYTGGHLCADRRGIAVEAQRVPNAPNRADLGPSTLRPGERYSSRTSIEVAA